VVERRAFVTRAVLQGPHDETATLALRCASGATEVPGDEGLRNVELLVFAVPES
jgi:hypothetical protein